MIWDERTDEATIQKVMDALIVAGYETERVTAEPQEEEPEEATEGLAAAQPEEIELTVSLPISNHTGNTLRNLVS